MVDYSTFYQWFEFRYEEFFLGVLLLNDPCSVRFE